MAMSIRDVVPTSSLVQHFGTKAIVYGGPGMAKTPLLTTAPNPIIAFSEPGFLSVRKWQGPAVECFTYARIKDFWMWAIGSQEAKQFGTFCSDSFSQIAEIVLSEEQADQASGKNKNPDPRNAYGEMSKKVMEIANWIYFAKNFNALLIAKEGFDDNKKILGPYFPGQDLNIKIPHLFDSVWRIEEHPTTKQKVVRTIKSYQAFARDRSGNLAEFEPADFTHLINKSKL